MTMKMQTIENFLYGILVLLVLVLAIPRLVAAGSVRYTYDHMGNRMIKETNTKTTVYPHALYHADLSTSSGNVVSGTTYVYANGQRVASITNGIMTWNHSDHLGSSSVTTDASGNVVQVIDYHPFGNERLNEGADQTARTFTDHISDSETDLLYMNARYYDDETRKFLSQDPWEGDLHNPQTLNKYSYVINNPLIYTDPSGEEPVKLAWAPAQSIIGPQYSARFYRQDGSHVDVPANAKGGGFDYHTGEFKGDPVQFFEEGLGIPRNKPIGQKKDVDNSKHTALEGIRQNTILGAISLWRDCDCEAMITGGTEKGHASGKYSHAKGYKLDFRILKGLTDYIESKFQYVGEGKYGPRYSNDIESGNIYNKETKINVPHWDVRFLENYSYEKLVDDNE